MPCKNCDENGLCENRCDMHVMSVEQHAAYVRMVDAGVQFDKLKAQFHKSVNDMHARQALWLKEGRPWSSYNHNKLSRALGDCMKKFTEAKIEYWSIANA